MYGQATIDCVLRAMLGRVASGSPRTWPVTTGDRTWHGPERQSTACVRALKELCKPKAPPRRHLAIVAACVAGLDFEDAGNGADEAVKLVREFITPRVLRGEEEGQGNISAKMKTKMKTKLKTRKVVFN